VRVSRLPLLCAAGLAALTPLLAPSGAFAAPPGGTEAPDGSTAGGAVYRPAAPQAGREAGPGPARRRSLLTDFALGRTRLFLYGRPATVSFRIDGSRPVHAWLRVLRNEDGALAATIDLGERPPGAHTVRFTGTETGVLPEGRYLVDVVGPGGRPAAAGGAELQFLHHRFPLSGPFDWGGDGARFGAPRAGHRHQGQDLAAAEGTPVVAPRGGVVETVQYQADGAGHYVVLGGAGEDRDYVFMHLRDGSIPVSAGERVRTGQRIGEVGSTGSSTGPHLHFEIWVGGWYAGGAPIDPLPPLQEWAAALTD
jgi:murein DD-endopeptidase MepM/ murein hydrolase activator NlpD